MNDLNVDFFSKKYLVWSSEMLKKSLAIVTLLKYVTRAIQSLNDSCAVLKLLFIKHQQCKHL